MLSFVRSLYCQAINKRKSKSRRHCDVVMCVDLEKQRHNLKSSLIEVEIVDARGIRNCIRQFHPKMPSDFRAVCSPPFTMMISFVDRRMATQEKENLEAATMDSNKAEEEESVEKESVVESKAEAEDEEGAPKDEDTQDDNEGETEEKEEETQAKDDSSEKSGDDKHPRDGTILPQRPVKRARTAYFIFADEKRPEVQKEVSEKIFMS